MSTENPYSTDGRPPSEGEDVALMGFTIQYEVAAEKIYASLSDDDFEKVVMKDGSAGKMDDVVIVLRERVEAYQVKWSQIVRTIDYPLLFEYFEQLVEGKDLLVSEFSSKEIFVCLYSCNIASPSKSRKYGSSPSEFLSEYWNRPNHDSDQQKWEGITCEIRETTNSDIAIEREHLLFELNRRSISEREGYDPNSSHSRIIGRLSRKLLELAGKQRGRIELNKTEILNLMGLSGHAEFKAKHAFDVPYYYFPVEKTVDELEEKIENCESGYLALIGTPGSGKSTLLTETLRKKKNRFVPYYCFVPEDSLVTHRSEASSFLHDILLSLKRKISNQREVVFGDTLGELRRELQDVLNTLSVSYVQDGIKTIILVDGLDHVKREGEAVSVLFNEFPKPSAIPKGVIFVMGSQRIDGLGLSGEIKQQLDRDRTINMSQLSYSAIAAITKKALSGYDIRKNHIDLISSKSSGHPLALNYILNQIWQSETKNLDDELKSISDYGEGIEAQYEQYWKSVCGNSNLRRLLALLSRIRIPLSESLIEELSDSEDTTRNLIEFFDHYFRISSSGKRSFFHNSFRQFILQQTGRNPFGRSDSKRNQKYHQKLTDVAKTTSKSKSFNDELLYHAYCSGNFELVADTATQSYLREQFLRGKTLTSINEDINLLIKSAKAIKSPIHVFRALFIKEEIWHRHDSLGELNIPMILVTLKRPEDAMRMVYQDNSLLIHERDGLELSTCFYENEYTDFGRQIFNTSEPIDLFESSNKKCEIDILENTDILSAWIDAAVNFRSWSQIVSIIQKLPDCIFSNRWRENDPNKARRNYFFQLIRTCFSRDPVEAEKLARNNCETFGVNKFEGFLAECCFYSEQVDSLKLRNVKPLLASSKLSKSLKLDLLDFLVGKGEYLREALELFATLIPPELDLNKTYLSPSEKVGVFLDFYRYHRLNSFFNTPIAVDELKIGPPSRDLGDVDPVLSILLRLSTLEGEFWQEKEISSAKVIAAVKDAIQLLENSLRPNGNIGLSTAFLGFYEDYLESVVSCSVCCLGEGITEIENEIFSRWDTEKGKSLWRDWIRRKTLRVLYKNGMSRDVFLVRFTELEEKLMLDISEYELGEYIELCKERIFDWAEIGEVNRAEEILTDAINFSFGVSNEKDYRINEWSDLFVQMLQRGVNVSADDFNTFLCGILTNAEGRRTRYSSEPVSDILTFLLQFNPSAAAQFQLYLRENGLLGFCDTVNAICLASSSDKTIPSTVNVVLLRELMVAHGAFEEKTIRKIVEGIDENQEIKVLIEQFEYLTDGIEIEIEKEDRWRWLNCLYSAVEGLQLEELTTLVRKKLEKYPTKLDHTSTTFKLEDGTEIKEEEFCEKIRDTDELIKLLDSIKEYVGFHWRDVLPSKAKAWDLKTTEKVLALLLDRGENGKDVSSLIERLIDLNKGDHATFFAKKALESSNENGWSHRYDGGSRIESYKHLIFLEEETREAAFDRFCDDYLSGALYHGLEGDLFSLMDLFYEKPPFDQLWLELKDHVFVFREFNFPTTEFDEGFSYLSDSRMALSHYVISFLIRSFSIPFPELRQDILKAITRVYVKASSIRSVVENEIERLLNGEGEQPVLGLSIIYAIFLRSENGRNLIERYKKLLREFCFSNDMTIRLFAKKLLESVGIYEEIKNTRELHITYRLQLDELTHLDGAKGKKAYDPHKSLFDTNDPLELVGVSRRPLELIHKHTNIPFRNLLERCVRLMRELVPPKEWDHDAEERLRSLWDSLDLKLSYRRPRAYVSLLALTHIIAELYDADVFNAQFLEFLTPWISVFDGRVFNMEPKPEFGSPVEVEKHDFGTRNEEWLNSASELPSSPIIENEGICLGFVTKSAYAGWSSPTETSVGMISPREVADKEMEDHPTELMGGGALGQYCHSDQYPNVSFSDLFLRDSLFLYSNPCNRAEFGNQNWLALNPLVGIKLNWEFSDDKNFSWVDKHGNLMVQSLSWQSGRLKQNIPYRGQRCRGWKIMASREAFRTLKDKFKELYWVCCVKRKYIEDKEEYTKSWSHLVEIK